jgi:multimeric flavodoxin WrbA
VTRVVVVFHSRGGRTRALAEAVAGGAAEVSATEVELVPVEDADAGQAALASADEIVFGCPTYMGSASAPFKAFMDKTSRVWVLQGWRDKLAAGFTHSAAPSGDKLGTLIQLAVFAAQHGMIWIGLGLPPSYAGGDADSEDTNRLGSHLGAMAQSRPGGGVLPASDLATATVLGRRVAEAARRWRRPASDRAVHPAARDWALPPPSPERKNLRALLAQPGRYEHHLVVCATIGEVQLEVSTASEPLYFAHVNLSDEYALGLATGDEVADRMPLGTFVSDPETGADLGRYDQRVGDLVLHPDGYMHWPGRLPPPHRVMSWPEGMRRAGLALVLCASRPTPPAASRPRQDEPPAAGVTALSDPPPPLLSIPRRAPAGPLARIGSTTLSRLDRPASIAPARGGWVVVLESDAGSSHAPGDVLRIPRDGSLAGDGIARALLLASDDLEPDDWPSAWTALPEPPFPPFEDAAPIDLPLAIDDALHVERVSDSLVRITLDDHAAEIPRYWLARTLFRVALHRLRLGYVETYGGLFVDDRADAIRIGLRTASGPHARSFERALALATIERIYRAVAPPGYRERLT